MASKSAVAAAILLGLGGVSPVVADEAGYFLSGAQKQELILRGQMHDEEQRLYDIWIVPGYVNPMEHAQKGWRKAGDSLETYNKPDFFPNLHKYADKTWRFGTRDTLREFSFKGTRKAWEKDMAVAKERTRKRVFGWWLAYPWGVFEASTESLLRLSIGIPTGILVAGSAYTVLPAVYVATPSVMSMAHAAGEGTGYPLIAAGWNTVIAPPLAVFGQRPAPQRADGFWMKQVDDPRLKDMIGELSSWRDALTKAQPTTERDAAVKRLEDERTAQTKDLYARIKVIEQASGEKVAQVRSEWMGGVMQRATEQRAGVLARLQQGDMPPELLAAQRDAVVAGLTGNGWTRDEADKLVDVLLGKPVDLSAPQRKADDKTDPVKRAVEILGNPK